MNLYKLLVGKSLDFSNDHSTSSCIGNKCIGCRIVLRLVRSVPLLWVRLLLKSNFHSLLLVLCNVMNKIRKRTDTAVAFTQEYSRVSYPLRNVSILSTCSGSSKDTHTGVGELGQRGLTKI